MTTYFIRRFRRIYPPLWTVIALGVVFFVVVDVLLAPRLMSSDPWMQPRPWWYSPSQWVGNLTLTETWRHYVFGSPRAHIPGQAWTLCYEEQFYAVMGLLLLAPRQLFAGAAAVSGLTVLVMGVSRTIGMQIDGVFLDGTWLTFAAGVLAYHSLNYRSRRAQLWVAVMLAAGAAAQPWTAIPGGLSAFVFAVAIVLLRPYDVRLMNARAARPIIYCGTMCYSLYLVHQWPVKVVSTALLQAGVQSAAATFFVTVPACVAVSVVLARLFYRHVEARFLNHPVRVETGPAIYAKARGEAVAAR